MSATATATKTKMGFEEFVLSIRKRVEHQGSTPLEASRALFDPRLIEAEAILEAAVIGFAQKAGTGQSDDRSLAASNGRNGKAGPHQKDKVASVLHLIQLRGADGTERFLIDFWDVDWEYFEARAGSLSKAWRGRERVSKWAAEQLHAHKVEQTKDLPADVLSELETRVQEAW